MSNEGEKIPVLDHHRYYIQRDLPGITDYDEALRVLRDKGHVRKLEKLKDESGNLMYPRIDVGALEVVTALQVVAVNTGNARFIQDEGRGTEGNRDAACGPCGNVYTSESGQILCTLDKR